MPCRALKAGFFGLLCVFVVNSVGAAEPWTTYRGNPQRTGCTDGKAGPATPKVLWALKFEDKPEHFVASPLPAGDRLYVTGLSGFNVAALRALSIDPAVKERTLWVKSFPLLKLPSVSTPAVLGDLIVFGDGMHQTNGATLHCLHAEKGRRAWQYPVPGTLVHLEGSPTVADGKVILGGGAAGVFCVDPKRLTLDGKEQSDADIRKALDKRWAELMAEYEAKKKTMPEFAVLPSEDQLPCPAPVLLWQQGQERWHVDAPVAVADGLVLVASAFLDKEQLGDRALIALDVKNGAVKWRAPLKLNPWGGPSVSGKTVVVTGSTIGYAMTALKGAKGDVAAFDLADGKEKWRKDIATGGALGCAALSDDLAVVTATDGKVRAFNLADGERRWIYDAKMPLFAPAAIAGDVAYVADLKGVVHAIGLKDGTAKWTLDLGTDPAVKAPGGVYGGPVLQDGRLYVATCNLEGAYARGATAVVCIGEK